MATQWIACPFLRRDGQSRPGAIGRYLIVQDFAPQIAADGGAWDYFECGGGPGTAYICGVGIVKIRASQATLNSIIAADNTDAIPAALVELNTLLSVVNNPTRNYIERTLTARLGYTDPEIDAWLNGANISTKTLGELFEFLASRWYRVVYEPTGTQVGYQGNIYPGVVACDGRTTTNGQISEPWFPLPKTPAEVAANVASG
jgi:hypothetical protein